MHTHREIDLEPMYTPRPKILTFMYIEYFSLDLVTVCESFNFVTNAYRYVVVH